MREGVCPKCHTEFKRPDHVPPNHPGYFCPACKEEGYAVLGVVHFTPDINANILPEEVMTA
jgi:hypothetical protein